MNIRLVTDTYYPRVNGVAKSILTFARQFEKPGHNVYIFTPQSPEEMESKLYYCAVIIS